MNSTQFFNNIDTFRQYPIGSVITITTLQNTMEHIQYGSPQFCKQTSFGVVTGYKNSYGSVNLLVNIITGSMGYTEESVEEINPKSDYHDINLIK